MSKGRCKECNHPGGTRRSTANLAKSNSGQGGTHGIQPKKPSCGCRCHVGL